MRKVNVPLGSDSYTIFIGHALGEDLLTFLREADFSGKALVITDTNVGPEYGEKLSALLRRVGFTVHISVIPAGEESKCLKEAERLYTEAIEFGLDRKSPVFALGGGVVGDLAGFIAATYMRGVPFIQLPTSLLAQVDSSVGGKVAVNHALGKNLIGAFYQPKAVFIDLDFLTTLPRREVSTGLGEIIKYGIIRDADFFAYLETHTKEALSLKDEVAEHMIARSCEIKAEVVGADEKEAGLRRILNFGHTLAHAIEKETGYSRYNHGEAVAIGMLGATRISREMQMTDDATVHRVEHLIEAMGLPVFAMGCPPDSMYEDLFHDKKTIGGKINWVLMETIGRVTTRDDVPESIVKGAIASCLPTMGKRA